MRTTTLITTSKPVGAGRRWLALLPLLLAFAGAAQTPTVTAVSPARNAWSAPTNSPVSLTFSQAIDAATAGNLRVHSSQRGGQLVRAGGGTVSGGGTATVQFAPAQAWRPGETVSVNVPATVQSTSGAAVQPHVQQFTTAAGSSGGGVFVSGYGSDVPTGGATPYGMVTGDVDGDGDLDVVSALYSLDLVRIDLNAGNGTFGNGTTVAGGSRPNAIALADIDNDGDLDMLVTNGTSAATTGLTTRYNDGTGQFPTSDYVGIGYTVRDLAVGDIDGDGDLDVVTANASAPASVLFMLNGGTGTYAFPAPLSLGTSLDDVALGDIDNDGDLDLLAASSSSGQFYARLNNGSGSFSGTGSVTGASGANNFNLGDIDGDGDLDAVLSKSVNANLTIYRNGGSGTFTQSAFSISRPPLFPFGSSATYTVSPQDAALADVDGDGDLDLLALIAISGTASGSGVTTAQQGEIRIWNNNGSGTFSAGGATSVGRAPKIMAVGDLDGDGDLDLLGNSVGNIVNAGAGTVNVRLNGASATSLTTAALSSNYLCRGRAVSVSFTAVGSFDISNEFTAQLSDANGSFASPVEIGTLRGETPGTISATIPSGTAPGTRYRIRVVSSYPPLTGTDNGADLTIYELSINTIAATATPNPVAAGGTISLDVTGANASLPGLTYAWTGPQSFTSSVRNPTVPNVTTDNDGIYRVTVSAGGCSYVSPVDVAVTSPSITAGEPLGGATQFCAGASISVPFTTNGPFPAGTTFTLSLTDAVGTSLITSSSAAALVNGGTLTGVIPSSFRNSTTLRARVTANKPTTTFTLSSNDLTVTNLNLSAPAMAISANTPVAEGADLTLSVNNVPLSGATFAWTGPNGFTDTTPNPTVPDVTTAAAGSYQVIVTLNGCSRTLTRSVTVTPTPRSITVSALTSNILCAGGTFNLPFTKTGSFNAANVFTAQLSNAAGAFSGITTLGTLAGPTAGTISATLPANLASGSNYRLRVIASSPSTTGTTSSFAVTVVNIGNLTVGSNSPLEEGQPLNLSASGAPAGVTYAWTGPNNFSSADQNLTLPAVTAAAAGTYSLTVAQGGCSATRTLGVVVNVAPLEVTAVSPTRNLRNASTTSPVGVMLSQAVSAATAGNLRVYSSQRGGQLVRAGGGTLSGGSSAQLSFAPTQPWLPGEVLSVSIPNTVRSLDGVRGVRPHVYQFTAAAGGSGGGTFASSYGSDVSMGAVALSNPALGDVDGDGDLDLVTPLRTQDRLRVNLNTGNGTYGPNLDVLTANNPSAVALGDVDGDGDLDALVTVGGSSIDGSLMIFYNNGTGGFSTSTTVLVNENLQELALGDVDGDGDLDVVTANSSNTPSMSLLLNNGSGIFTLSANGVAVGNALNDIALGDVDNDGDLDMVAVSYSQGQLFVRLNDGSGIFSGTGGINCPSNPFNLTLGDIDGDGDLDVAVGKMFENQGVSLFRNNGSGSFTISSTSAYMPTLVEYGTAVTVSYLPIDVAFADVDGDGDLDLAVLTRIRTRVVFNGSEFEGRGEIRVFTNDGSGTFSPHGATSVGVGPGNLTAGDVDGDGDLDFATNSVGDDRNGTDYQVNVRLNGASVSSLTTSTLTGFNFCQGGSLDVPFTAVGNFDVSNVFRAQLSDASGSFATPTEIGLLRGVTPGTINAHIPAATPLGSGYRVRVVSSQLPFVGTDNGTDIVVFELNASNITATAMPSPVAAGGTISLNVTGAAAGLAGLTYSWTGPQSFTSSVRNPTVANTTTNNDGIYRVTVSGGGCSYSSPVTVTVTPPGITATNPVGGATQFCAGASISVPFTTDGPFPAGTTFTLSLTDATATSVIATITGTSGGTITGTIPSSFRNSSTLRARVTANRPTGTVADSPTDLTVTNLALTNPALAISANTPVVEGNTLTLDVVNVPLSGATFAWTGPNGFTASVQNPTVPSVTPAAAGIYQVTVTLNGCSRTLTRSVAVTAAPGSITVGSLAAGTVCAGSTFNLPFTVTGTFNAGNVFTAQLSNAAGAFASGVTTLGTLPGTAAGTISATVPAGTAAGAAYRVRVVANSPSVTSTNSQAMTVTAAGTVAWLGGVSTDWFTAGNWSCGQVPTATTNVTIGAGATYYPVVTGGTATASNLTVAAGASFAIASTLNVRGDLTIDGSWTAGGNLVFVGGTGVPNLISGAAPVALGNVTISAGTTVQLGKSVAMTGNWTNNSGFNPAGFGVTLQGTAPQTLGGSQPTRFYDLTVQNPAGARCASPTGITHVLTLTTGNLAANDLLTLHSNATGTAMVVNPAGGGLVTGRATMERFITGSTTLGYRHYASPMQAGTATVQEFADDLPGLVLNPAYNTLGNSVTPFPTFFEYAESRLTAAASGFDQGWQVPAATAALVPLRGYSVQTNPTTTVDVSGELNNGPVSIALTRGGQANSGWNLLGNPYPAPIDWDLVPATPGLDKALYVFAPSGRYTGAYRSYVNGVGQNGGSKDLAAMQGFFVRATAPAATLSLSNAVRHTSYASPVFGRSTAPAGPLLRLEVRNAQGQADETVLYSAPDAAAGYAPGFDAYKVQLNGNGRPSLWSQAGNEYLAINGLPDLTTAGVIPLGLRVSQPGAHTLVLTAWQNAPAGTRVLLEDRLLGRRQDLTTDSVYTFTMHPDSTRPRFFLWFQGRPTATTGAATRLAISLYPNPTTAGHAMLTVSNLREQAAVPLEVLNAIGQVVQRRQLPVCQGVIQTNLLLEQLPAGVYSLRLHTAEGPVVRRLVKE